MLETYSGQENYEKKQSKTKTITFIELSTGGFWAAAGDFLAREADEVLPGLAAIFF